MKYIMYLLFGLPNVAWAQSRGIQFDREPSWDKVIEEAKTGKKFIFVDYYATWCGPCKAMDSSVYTDEKVANFVQNNFTSIRIQMDSAKTDDSVTKRWYNQAKSMRLKYRIASLPTFLFFSPNGDLVHEGIGYQDPKAFITLCMDALDSTRQYYTLLRKVETATPDYQLFPGVIEAALAIKEDDTAKRLSAGYVTHYLRLLDSAKLLTIQNIRVLTLVTNRSQDFGFHLFYNYGAQIDRIMKRDDYSKGIVDWIISKEEIYPNLWGDKDGTLPIVAHPKWKRIEKSIREKYDDVHARRTVLDAKILWFSSQKDWNQYGKSVVQKVEVYGPYGMFSNSTKYNQLAWDLFLHCNSRAILEKALQWSDSAIQMSPVSKAEKMDTRANILYKLGRRGEALNYEYQAVQLAPMAQDIRKNYEQMKQNKPTWPANS